MRSVPHNLIAIDLAMHQTGIAVFRSTNDALTQGELKDTITVKDVINGEKFQEGDVRQLVLAFNNVIQAYPVQYSDLVGVEYNPEEINKALEKFQLCIGSMILQYKSATDLVSANHGMAVANKYCEYKRKTFPAGREGNKKGILANVAKLFPDHHFASQDEADASFMGGTMIQDYVAKGMRL